jgi:glycosyltransferase involved in cell wall biosynthesis
LKTIGIDTSIAKINQAGSSVYVNNLTHALSSLDGQYEYSLFNSHQNYSMGTNTGLKKKFKTIYNDLIWTQLIVPLKAQYESFSLLHMPAVFSPMFPSKPTIVTIFDVIIMRFPQYFSKWHHYYFEHILPKSLENSVHIITISESSKRDLVKYYDIPQEKISVTYLSHSEKFRVIETPLVEIVKNKYGLKKYIILVGTIEPRKNILRILLAFSKVLKNHPDVQLVHVGSRGWGQDKIFSKLDELNIRDSVRLLGKISLDDLVGLYNGAIFSLYPSLYEGFGLPILESMAAGCPVITSNTSSMPEVAGDAAVIVNPASIESIYDGMCQLLGDNDLLLQYKDKGIKRSSTFSWQKCASETQNIYSKIVL